MEMNNPNENNQKFPPAQSTVFTSALLPKATKPPREFTLAEKLLAPIALLIAILFDRLVVAPLFRDEFHMPYYSSIFWMLYLVILYAVYWKRLVKNKILWLVTAFVAALCVWNLLFDYRGEYGTLTYFVIPAVLMAHAQFLAEEYKLKDVGKLAIAWLLGWAYKPFCYIDVLFESTRSMASGEKQKYVKKTAIGIAITLPLLLVIIPLLCNADMVFGYYLEQIIGHFKIPSFILHTCVVAIALMLFYSFLWSIGFAERKKDCAVKKEMQIDLFISCIVLGAIELVYLLFCIVQFTYLFAEAGLPGDLTYAEYAKQGFAQMIVICGINLVLFGTFMYYGKKSKIITVLLGLLLGLTAVILTSSFARLKLYIDTYRLTWLRLLSMWFIIYLAVVIILCGVRMIKKNLPLIAVSAIILLVWYTILGYSNPDALILRYSLAKSENTSAWLDKNKQYIASLSDNAILTLLKADVNQDAILYYIVDTREGLNNGLSFSSYQLRQMAKERSISID